MTGRHGVSPVLCIALLAAAALAACSSSSSSNGGKGRPLTDGGVLFGDGSTLGMSISPPSSTLSVDPASPPQTIQFTVSGAGDQKIRWRVVNPAAGTIDQNGLFTASGEYGGTTEIEAKVGTVTLRATVTITVDARQNGNAGGTVDAGVGGLEGVGGEGFGGAIPADLVKVLEGTPEADPALAFLYPYDQTVFPLGVLPPLLQWTDGGHGAFDAVYVHLSATNYDYRGFFGRPALLPAGQSLVRHPIPRDAWRGATQSAAGGTLSVEVVVAAGGKAYGPLRATYRIALAPIHGKIYYQAYNTALAQNYDATAVTGERLGGATLSITVGDESPRLVAGRTTDDHSGCRVCHSVSAYGDRMIVQHGDDYMASSSIDLKNGNAETTPYAPGLFGWMGIYPDGTLGLGDSIDVGGPPQVSGTTGLYDLVTGAAVPTQGLLDFATQVGLPAFSPDGRHVAFSLFAGPSTAAVGPADGRKLVSMDFDLATRTFSSPRKLWETGAGDERPAWCTFLPSSDAVVFQRRWDGDQAETFATRYGARGELWWVDLATSTATPLASTNGIGANGQAYVPRSAAHPEDERLNYEPSISPVASGGYAWMVFLSRRQYGSVATMDPYFSDPREHDLRTGITTKKLWMAAIDLNPKPGEDPSHPAFYIPGQELHGVNSRPFFALDPCVTDRGTCSTGVDCCSGFCRDGLCVEPPRNECSANDEKCAATSDCCDTRAQCISGFCAPFIQ